MFVSEVYSIFANVFQPSGFGRFFLTTGAKSSRRGQASFFPQELHAQNHKNNSTFHGFVKTKSQV